MATGEKAVSAGGDHAEDAGRALIHEFRNLLAVIINYSELIADEAGDAEAVKTDIKEVRSAAERAIALTEKLPRAGRGPGDPPAPSGS